jgi:hypothetical protein
VDKIAKISGYVVRETNCSIERFEIRARFVI